MAKELRQAYQDTLKSLIIQDTRVVMLDADLVSASGSTQNFKKFPTQCINCGIAEANMISVACGLSLSGCIPFVHTFAPFASRRVFDQLYVSGAFSQNHIHVYGSEPGVWAQYNGGTHTSFEDLAMVRTLPNTIVTAPCDPYQFQFILMSYYRDSLLYYTRAPRKEIGSLYDANTDFTLGKWIGHGLGKDGCIITMGSSVYDALIAQKTLQNQGIALTVIDAYSIYPYDLECIQQCAKTYKHIMVVENHSIYGGLGELVGRELALLGQQTILHHLGIQHHVSEVGDVSFLKHKYKIDSEAIISAWQSIYNI